MTSMTTGDIKDYVADLSAYDFSTRYQSAVMNRVKQDGKTMYLPLPSSYYGYVMNVTLVEQLGLEMPTTQQELLELLRTAQQQGVGAAEDGTVISTNNVDGYALGNMITGAEVPDFLGLAQGEEWLSDFLAGDATFAGSWDESLDFFLTLTDEGLMDIERLDGSRNVVNVQKAMAEGQMIACFGSSLYLDQIRGLDSDYEFTMLPFLSAEGHSSWVMSDPVACIAINKTLEGEGNEAKLDACVRVLDLLSTPEGQQAIMEDTKADNSYLTEPVASVKSEQTGLEDAAAAGYTAATACLPRRGVDARHGRHQGGQGHHDRPAGAGRRGRILPQRAAGKRGGPLAGGQRERRPAVRGLRHAQGRDGARQPGGRRGGGDGRRRHRVRERRRHPQQPVRRRRVPQRPGDGRAVLQHHRHVGRGRQDHQGVAGERHFPDALQRHPGREVACRFPASPTRSRWIRRPRRPTTTSTLDS